MVIIHMKKLAENWWWISREFRKLSASYAWWERFTQWAQVHSFNINVRFYWEISTWEGLSIHLAILVLFRNKM